MTITPASVPDQKVVTKTTLDRDVSSRVSDPTSLTRAALKAILPTESGGGGVPHAAQLETQTGGGVWTSGIRTSDVTGRIYVATVDGSKRPTRADGLVPGDVLIVPGGGVFVARSVPSSGAATWEAASGPTTGTPTTPTNPTPADPTPTPGDTTTPSPTSRPYAVLGSTGTVSSPPGVSVADALSDQNPTGITITPSGGNQGISLALDMSKLVHDVKHDLTLTLWAASGSPAGDVTASVGYQGRTYAAAKTVAATGAASAVAFTWPTAAQLSLPTSTWRDVEVTVSRGAGGLTIGDLTLQSLPPTTPTIPGSDPTVGSAILWAPSSVWYSDCSAAPLSKSSAAIGAYVRGQATSGVRLDAYADAAPIWMVPASTARVNVVPLASTRGAATLMHTADGKGALDGVPIPANMTAPTNQFKTTVIACVETKQVWELLGLVKTATGWAAEWSGRIDGVTANGGVMPVGTGYTGSGVAWAAGAIKVTEAADAAKGNARTIPHALGLNLAYGTARGEFCWPATRTDGTSYDAGAPKMGQRVKLKATADLSRCTPLGKAVGEALKRYGAVILGGADRVSLVAESGATEQARTGVDPWGEILGGSTVDSVLAGLPLDQLEAVSPGWGDPGWKPEPDVTVPTTPTTPPVTGMRRQIYMRPDALWLSGASCYGIEGGAEGMGSAYAQWRGEPCWMARSWSDAGAAPNGTGNDPAISALFGRFGNWHASIDVGIGFISPGENMGAAASGSYDGRWITTIQNYRRWWTSRRTPSQVNAFLSPAHEMNGNWYAWSVNSGNYQAFMTAWKRFRSLQLTHFPEAILCFNVNRESVSSGIDWRKTVPGYAEGKTSQFIDIGGVDYYNQNPNAKTQAEFDSHALQYDGYGGPKGIERHRTFWESQGLGMIIPEWSNNALQGDAPEYATAMHGYVKRHAGVGPGKICAEALFNKSSGYPAKFAVMGDVVGSPAFAQRCRDLVWGK